MSSNFDAQSCMDAAIRECDQDEPTSATFITSDDLLEMTRDAALRLGGVVQSLGFGDQYFSSFADLTTDAGTTYVIMPVGLLRIENIGWLRGPGDMVPLRRASNDEVLVLGARDDGWSGSVPRYRMQFSLLHFFPTPQAAHTVRVVYTTGIVVVSGATTIEGGPGWKQWIVADLCAQIRRREEKDDGQFIRLRNEAEGIISASAPKRDKNAVYQVRDTYDDNQPDWMRDRRII